MQHGQEGGAKYSRWASTGNGIALQPVLQAALSALAELADAAEALRDVDARLDWVDPVPEAEALAALARYEQALVHARGLAGR